MNIPGIIVKHKNVIRKWLDIFTDDLKEGVDTRTPVDKKKLIGNTKRSEIIEIWNTLQTRVYNDTDYVKLVEYWVKGREYNYNIPNDPDGLKSGVWAGMFRRTKFDMEDKLPDYILKKR